MRSRKMSYFVSFADFSHSFRNARGDLHRDWAVDHSSDSSLMRSTKRSAFKLARRLVREHGSPMVVEQCYRARKHGKTGRWSRWMCVVTSGR